MSALAREVCDLPPFRLLGDIKPAARGEESPNVTGTCLVAPDVLAITIEAGKVTLGKVLDYVPQAGDDLSIKKDARGIETVTLKRGGKEIGEVVGAGDKRQYITQASYSGDPLQTELADHAGCYTISSADDPAYAAGLHPAAVHRKSKPIDWFGFGGMMPARHVVFLHLPRPLGEGKSYRIDCGRLNVKTPVLTHRNDTRAARSLAVHTTQIGYRADDPFKRGYLSIWLGTSAGTGAGGAFHYPAGLKFHLLDDAGGKEVFSGAVEMAKAATDKELMFKDMNFNGTDVLRMDFSSFRRPGRYRLYVEGIGCGYPFEIGPGAWEHAFRVQMRGFYHQRSGIALGPPYTTFVKPRDHHPDDGVPVLLSKYADSIWSGEKEPKLWDALKDMATNRRMTNGWGGYHDAGDWNPRRVTHLRATLAQLEIADLFPEYVAKLKLNIPQDYKVPDLFNEALFEIDCFRRMQTPEGGVGFGLETAGDPAGYTVSWHTKVLPVYMASPDAGNSWLYAAAAARASLPWPSECKLSGSVTGHHFVAHQGKEKGKTAGGLKWTVRDFRNLAAVEMLRLTGDRHWHDVFMENTVLANGNPNLYAYGKAIQSDAAFAYAIADEKLTDSSIRQRAVQGLEREAAAAITYANGNAFDIVCEDKGRPMFMGFYSTPWDGRVVLRAYHLTGRTDYLAAGIRACQFSSGANPENLVETTGLGSNPILHPLRLDPRISGQPVPEGLTVYGIEDHVNFPCTFCYWILPAIDAVMSPKYLKWPVTESYTDTYCFIMVNEFTTDIWDQSTWTWGYLAARP